MVDPFWKEKFSMKEIISWSLYEEVKHEAAIATHKCRNDLIFKASLILHFISSMLNLEIAICRYQKTYIKLGKKIKSKVLVQTTLCKHACSIELFR